MGALEVARAGTLGWIDSPLEDTVVGSSIVLYGWALDPKGIQRIEVVVGSRTFPARFAIARTDVAAARPGFPDSAAAGWEFSGDFRAEVTESGGGSLVLEIVAVNNDGHATTLGRRTLIPNIEKSRWRSLWEQRSDRSAPPFFVVPGVSGVGLGSAAELDRAYEKHRSPTFGVGMRVPILYMRTTRGASADFVFDPSWDTGRKCGDRRIADDSLNEVFRHARTYELPVLFTLNGGVWGDATCDVPEWDATDHLELDSANVQWNELGFAERDDALKDLPGAQTSPELARMLTYHVFAERNRFYKKRNLQAAGRLIAEFARTDPKLFVGVNLDPDTTLNPFFEGKQWYDYNPGMLRQFRHWLAGTGPYSGNQAVGVPDLRAYKRNRPLSLEEAGRLAGRRFKSWQEVEPPRSFPVEGNPAARPYWQDAWHHEWEVFRRHVIDLHYDELSSWLVDVGIPSTRIFSAQGFMAPHDQVQPFAVRIDSPTKNYDSGGVSVEGAVPKRGHLGAVIYGPSAYNDIPMETQDSLFATFRRFDPRWAIVEFNTADLRVPDRLPTYEQAYRSFRDAFNFGARLVSPMAWNGSNGIFAGQPGYVSYMSWRNTPAEEALRDFALTHAYVPLGARLWSFGTPKLAHDDGWTAGSGTKLEKSPGRLGIGAVDRSVVLLSPERLALRRGEVDLMVLDVVRPESLADIVVEAKGEGGVWSRIATFRAGDLARDGAGLLIPLSFPRNPVWTEQLRLKLSFDAGPVHTWVRHIALWPPKSARAAK